jgi:hypothetical protein
MILSLCALLFSISGNEDRVSLDWGRHMVGQFGGPRTFATLVTHRPLVRGMEGA